MTRIQAQVKAIAETRALYVVGGVLVMLLAIYTYLVIGIILEVVLRQELEVSIKEKNSAMAALEARYLYTGQEITRDYALNHGFVPLDAEEFASRDKLSHAITETSR